MHASISLRRAVSLALLAAPLAAQTYPPPQWPLGAGPPRGLAAGQPADGTLFKEVDQLGHQDGFWHTTLVGDADHDGLAEVVLNVQPLGGGTNSIVFYEDDGAGQYNQVHAFTLAEGELLAIGDVDEDGLTDLFFERALGPCHFQFVWMEASSPAGFPDHEVWTAKKEGDIADFRGAIADVDGDGRREFIVADDSFTCLPTTIKIYEATSAHNQLTLIFAQPTNGDLGNPVIADFDLDGKQEIAVAEFDTQAILLFETTGDDAFALTFMTVQPLFNAYEQAVITRLSPDARPMLFLAGQHGNLDFRVGVYESLTPDTLSLVNEVQVPNNCGASVPQIWAMDLVGTRVPEIMLDRLCDPVPIYQVGLNGAMQLYDAPLITLSYEICAAPRSATHSGAVVVGTLPSRSNPHGSTFVLEQP